MQIAPTRNASGVLIDPFAAPIETISALETAHFTFNGTNASTAQIILSSLAEINSQRGTSNPLIPICENLVLLCSRLNDRVTTLEQA